MNVDVRVDDAGQLHQPVHLRPLRPAAPASVFAENGVADGPPVVTHMTNVLPEPNKNQRGRVGIAVADAELLAQKLGEIDAVRFPDAEFMVSRLNRKNAVLHRPEDLHALLQRLHGHQILRVDIADAVAHRHVHKVAVQDHEAVFLRQYPVQLLSQPFEVAVDISNVRVRQRQNVELVKLPQIVLDNLHALISPFLSAAPPPPVLPCSRRTGAHFLLLERQGVVETPLSVWKADVIPLNYWRIYLPDFHRLCA